MKKTKNWKDWRARVSCFVAGCAFMSFSGFSLRIWPEEVANEIYQIGLLMAVAFVAMVLYIVSFSLMKRAARDHFYHEEPWFEDDETEDSDIKF